MFDDEPIVLNFSDICHVSLMLDGLKKQTTRSPKNLKIGDTVECRYNDNVLIGHATVTDIIKYRGGLVFENLRDVTKENWAIKDGFPNFEEADKFMSDIYGAGWQSQEMECIYLKGDWIKEEEV